MKKGRKNYTVRRATFGLIITLLFLPGVRISWGIFTFLVGKALVDNVVGLLVIEEKYSEIVNKKDSATEKNNVKLKGFGTSLKCSI